tara:strand:- start:288 stop:617 length:330 start_codon:yes stop_codon:yes gene_type:complete
MIVVIRKMKSGSEIPNKEFSIIFGLKMKSDEHTIPISLLKKFLIRKYSGMIVRTEIVILTILWTFIKSIISGLLNIAKNGERKIDHPNLFIMYPSGKISPLANAIEYEK